MNKKILLVVVLVVACVGVFAAYNCMRKGCCFSSNCGVDGTPIQGPMTPLTNPDQVNLTADNNRFALRIYSLLGKKDGNLFLSPYSISSALAMTYAGARGKTETEMKDALSFSLPQERLHPAFYAQNLLLSKIGSSGELQLSISNSIWPHHAYTFLPQYVELLKSNYRTEVVPVDYVNATEEARRLINGKVEEQTSGKIKELIPEGVLGKLTRLVLTNAVYFKGLWQYSFEKSATRPMPFTSAPGATADVPMMFQEGKFRYYADTALQALELPYRGGSVSMLVILPRDVDGYKKLESSLTPESLSGIVAGLAEMELKVYLPKFEITSEFDLAASLKALGMPLAFSTAADFSGMDGTQNLYIHAALHKAFVAVDEEGTEAAAATAVVINAKSAPMFEQFLCDHPFLFLIRENATGSIVFMGRVATP